MNTRLSGALLAAGATLILTACGSSGSPAGSAGVLSGPGKNVDVCAALPTETASQITGATFTSTQATSVGGLTSGCMYSGQDGSLLQITVMTSGGSRTFDQEVSALTQLGIPPTSISGVGDKAFSAPDPNANGLPETDPGAIAGAVTPSSPVNYGAVFGDTYIQIGGLTSVTADQGKQIVELLHSKL